MTESKKYEVHVSKACYSSLEQHTMFIANVSKNAAKKFQKSFHEAVVSLEMFPERGERFKLEAAPNLFYRRVLFDQWYALLYETDENNVYVDLIMDLRRDINNIYN